MDEFLPFDDDQGPMEQAFWVWHRENPHVYEAFSRFAFQIVAAGYNNFGAGAVWERLRWHAHFETRGEPWKLNNNYRAFYARLWMRDNPEYDGFFRTRKQRVKFTGAEE